MENGQKCQNQHRPSWVYCICEITALSWNYIEVLFKNRMVWMLQLLRDGRSISRIPEREKEGRTKSP